MIKKDTILIFTQEEYDDYSIRGTAKALTDFDLEEQKKEYAPLADEKAKEWIKKNFECPQDSITDGFITFLKAKGLVCYQPVTEIWCGSYDKFDIEQDEF